MSESNRRAANVRSRYYKNPYERRYRIMSEVYDNTARYEDERPDDDNVPHHLAYLSVPHFYGTFIYGNTLTQHLITFVPAIF